MKKFLLSTSIIGFATAACAQTCPQIEGLTPIPVRFGINVYGAPESVFPIAPLYWNRFYKVDETTGQLVSASCAYTGDPNIHELAACVCYLTGLYFRSVTDVCDPTPCGGDVAGFSPVPKTNNSNSSSNWSQSATWVGGIVPDMSSASAALITKSTQLDVDINLTANHWVVFSGGNSSINSGTNLTCNAVIQVYPVAQLENFGTLRGTGEITGSLINSGILSPGNSPGKFTIVGNYTATGTAVHEIEIAAAGLYDTINVTRDSSFPGGNVVLNGTLNVSLLNGFLPASGDNYKIITYKSATGSFANTNLPVLPAGLSWNIHYNPSDITLEVNAVALPLTILYSRAFRQNSGVQLTWGTADEINVKNYNVERSIDGSYFTKVGMVAANGASANNYSWFDPTPANGNNYYRIKAIDMDGKFMYSGIQVVNITGKNDVIAFPNPVNRGEILRINLQNSTAAKLELMNATGQILYSKDGKLTGNISIPVSAKWPVGQYIMRMIIGNKVEVKKIQVQ